MNDSDGDFNSLMESIDGANFSVDDFAGRMSEASYPLEEMKAKMEALGISGVSLTVRFCYPRGMRRPSPRPCMTWLRKGPYTKWMPWEVPLQALQGVMYGTAGSAEHMADVIKDTIVGCFEKMASSADESLKGVIASMESCEIKVSETTAGIIKSIGDVKGQKTDTETSWKATTDCFDVMKTAADTPLSTLASTAESKMQACVISVQTAVQAMVSNTTNKATWGHIHVNVYGAEGQDVRLLAEEVGDILNQQLLHKIMVFA